MLVIVAEIFLILLLLRRQGTLHRKKLLFLSFLTQAFILVFYRIELEGFWERIVYWSDAEYYWNALLGMLSGQKVESYNILYVYYSYFLQITSPFVSPLWNNLSNILLIDLSFLFIVQFFLTAYGNPAKGERLNPEVYLVTIGNPLVIYALLRNLKDSLFLFLVVSSVYLYAFAFKRLSKNGLSLSIFSVLYLMSFSIILTLVRPWGWIIPVITSIGILVSSPSKSRLEVLRTYIPIFSVTLLFAYMIVRRHFGSVLLWLNAREQWSQEVVALNNPLGLVSAPFRLLIGPGPLRSLLGSQYFWFYTFTGNACSFAGSLLWWFLFPMLLVKMLLRGITKTLLGAETPFLLIFSTFLGVYSFFYGGSAELRFRGVLYVLLSTVWVNDWFRKNASGYVQWSGDRFSPKRGALFLYCALLFILVAFGVFYSF